MKSWTDLMQNTAFYSHHLVLRKRKSEWKKRWEKLLRRLKELGSFGKCISWGKNKGRKRIVLLKKTTNIKPKQSNRKLYVNLNLPGFEIRKNFPIIKVVRYYPSRSSSRKRVRYFYDVTYICQTVDNFLWCDYPK